MKSIKINILSVAVLMMVPTIFTSAQKPDSVVNKSVTVTREFQPVISDVNKVVSVPAIVEPVVVKSTPVYSNITTPLTINYKIQTLPAEELLHTAKEANKGFLRLGMGVPLNSLVDFMYPILNTQQDRLDISLHHLGAFVDKKHSKTSGALQYDHLFKNFDLYAGIGGSHDFFNYYGSPFASTIPFIMSEEVHKYENTIYRSPEEKNISLYDLSGLPLDDTHWRFNANVGVRSIPLAENLIFDASLNYKLFNAMNGDVLENQILLKGLFEVPFDQNRLGMDIHIYNFGYSVGGKNPDFTFPSSYNLIKINPYVKFTRDNWFLRLGAKTGISIGGAGQVFTPSADVSSQWNAMPDYFALYAGVTGDLTVNSLYNIYNENRYLSPKNRLEDTYTPVDAYLGAKISPTYNLLIDFYGQYKIISNQYFYINREYTRDDTTAPFDMPVEFKQLFHNRFDVVESHASRASLGLRTVWDYKNQASIYLKGAHHFWSVKDELQAWHLPSWDVDFGASVKVGNDIDVNTQFIFQGGRYAKLSESKGTALEPVFDWNIGASYSYNDWMSIFVKVNNILNKKYEFFKGYDVQGINAMVGAAFSF